MAYQVDDS